MSGARGRGSCNSCLEILEGSAGVCWKRICDLESAVASDLSREKSASWPARSYCIAAAFKVTLPVLELIFHVTVRVCPALAAL
jgi:hypothetical protein